ncbi:DUF333 domain-containing protein [Shewanella eurypsychrophilus]|uniref:DUF333 domain-containing protein n=1 Tax=Shewanella eurypsychrophilus TaxID=2593656 RepID=A0ABX6VAB5_9GAMM|nr:MULTISPECIES: DUF333 domain-containing protein [Shewanella]QFU23594.1 DUF333 domain-containing protein [Shewanella sp. YLB-09]QPG58818.1 DUF333 domain-containing protein [Shewanella eurypsychrophilus]
MKNMNPSLFSNISFAKLINGVFIGVGLLIIFLALAACSIHEDVVMANMSNPASDYCLALDGKLEIVTGPDGQQGICTLPSGEVIEEWALYRRDHQDK